MESKEIENIIKSKVYKSMHCGSRITCDPPVIDTDDDYIILIDRKNLASINLILFGVGFELGGSVVMEADSIKGWDFWSYTNANKINFIFTASEEFYLKFVDATILSKSLNLLKKEDRIRLFQYVLYGNLDTNNKIMPLSDDNICG